MISRISKSVALTVWLFVLLYTPPLISFNVLHLVTAVSIIVLLQKYSLQLRIALRCRGIAVLILGFAIALILLFTTLVFTTRSFTQMYSIAMIPTEVLISSLLFVFVTKSQGLSFDNVLMLILNAGLLQAIISVAMFFNPVIKRLIIDNFLIYGDVTGSMSYWSVVRTNGFSTGLNFAMPVVQGFMASIATAYSLRKSFLYILYVPPLLFSVLVNARTGIVVFAVSSLVFIMMSLNTVSAKRFAALLSVVATLVVLFFFIPSLIERQSNATYNWILLGFEEIKLFFSGETTGYFEALESMFFLPAADILVFGSGRDYYWTGNRGVSSDIGYVNDLFLGGFFFVFALYGSFLYFVSWGRVPKHWINLPLKLAMMVVILLINIKGFGFRQTAITNLFVLISTFLCFSRFQHFMENRDISPNFDK